MPFFIQTARFRTPSRDAGTLPREGLESNQIAVSLPHSKGTSTPWEVSFAEGLAKGR